MNKLVTLLIIFILLIFYLPACKTPDKLEDPIITTQLNQHQSIDTKDNFLKKENFIRLIGNTNDIVEFKEDGKVNVQLNYSKQIFDITDLHQRHRLVNLKNLFTLAR